MDCLNDMYCFSSPEGMLVIGILFMVAIIGNHYGY